MSRWFASTMALLLGIHAGASSISATTRVFTGADIPSRLETGTAYIFADTDSLYLDGRLLVRGVDYRFHSGEGYFDLSKLTPGAGDTLVVTFQPVPFWVSRSYGRPLPEISGTPGSSIPVPTSTASLYRPSDASRINLSGAKSFRFSARSAGDADFGQSLDLNISGDLAPGLGLSGSISDRGFNPAYGTANSRLNELDRVNLTLKSTRLTAQVGDIMVERQSSSRLGKAVSGAAFDLDYSHWHLSAAAARPRGQFATFVTMGGDGFQGPYQIGRGSDVLPVVPGSETVWLDGKELERGANKDYVVDYPAGRITFTARRPIDSRSRIEIDYEPQATDYKKELLSAGGGARLGDSTLNLLVQAVREGDDKDQPLAGSLSPSEMHLLAASGDSAAARSGITPDSNGSYVLIPDFLPDSVYQYVGAGNGGYSIRFSFVGSGKGEYQFQGGERYEYVGSRNGDYSPVIILPAAQRNDYYRARLGARAGNLGDLLVDVRTSSFDRNLLSDIDDDDNEALFYLLQMNRKWLRHGRPNFMQVQRRVRQPGFMPRERINRADFNRDFLTPENFVAETDETLTEIAGAVSPASSLDLTASFGTLAYADRFDSRAGRLGARWDPSRGVMLRTEWRKIASDLENAVLSGDGNAVTYIGELAMRPLSAWQIVSRYENDRRDNRYFDRQRGTRYQRAELSIAHGSAEDDLNDASGERITYELRVEDSLSSTWQEVLTRNRLSSSSSRRFGDLVYDATLSYQWLQRPAGDDNSFLARIGGRYTSIRHRLTVNSAYTVSEEQRNARGITYLEVEPGFGNFSREDGNFVPDPDGDFIEVEEILSVVSRVRRAEKSFHVNKDWRSVLVRFTSNIEEELKPEGKRSIWWLLPFIADQDQPYLFFSGQYDAELRIGAMRGFHVANLLVSEEIEIREIAGSPRPRRDRKGRLSFKQAVKNSYLEEGMELFRFERDGYFVGSGDIEGYELSLMVRQVLGGGEFSSGGSYRRADSDDGARSDLTAVNLGTRIKVIQRGEFRSTLQLYRQTFTDLTGAPSYQLTGNRPGEKGAVWSTSVNYGVRSGLRISLSLNGRHADDRAGRVTGRGEVVATF